jgi:mono/diheme cytochrome c family protein
MRTTLASAIFLALLGSSVASADGTAAGAAELYAARCAFCHGVKGAGDGVAGDALQPRPTSFASTAYWKAATDDQVRAAIVNGKPGTAMVPFGQSLRPEEIDALVGLLRSFAPGK